jgi:hypothetical protein
MPATYVIDPKLRVLKVLRIGNDPAVHVKELIAFLSALPKIEAAAPAALQAPVLVLPHIFEPEFCRRLIALYHEQGAEDSGFMKPEGKMTIGAIDYGMKRRHDCWLVDEAVRAAIRTRIGRKADAGDQKSVPIRSDTDRALCRCLLRRRNRRSFQSAPGNTTKATAHRRFAVSLSLNAGDYVGFPEFGSRVYHAPAGGAVVFSCSLLHEAMPVTKGKRYVALPFLYDDAGASVREKNKRYPANDSD